MSSRGETEHALTRESWEATPAPQLPECVVEHCLRPPYGGPVCKQHADLMAYQARTHAEHGRVD